MANALIISKQTGGYFSFNLSINGAVQDEVRSIQNDLLTVGNTLHFKTSNGANIIKQQDITPAELTIIASGTFTFATVTQVWDKLIEVGFFDWLGTGGGAGVDRFDELLDTFQYFGKDGYVCIVNESQQKLEAVPFYNYRKFTDLEDSPSFLVPNKMVVVNPTGDALILQDQPATPDTYLNSVGYFDYNDSITHTTPLPFVSNTPKKLTNDTLGANTNTSENPYGVSFVWDSSVNQFNFSQLSVGDTVDIRIQIQVTTTSANQKFKVSAKFGIGSVAQFENTILSTQVKTAGLEEISFVAPFYIGSSYIRDFPAELYITSDAGGSVIVDGWYIRILRKNINIITIESSVPDATTLVKGIVRLGGDLSGTADNPTVPALATKIANTRLINTSAPLTGGGDLSADRTISIPQANTSTNGYLSGGDWTTFNNKQGAISLTTTGSSGASTFITNTLNIPNYTLAGLGGQPLDTGLTSLSSLSYISPAFVKMTGIDTFTLDTTVYENVANKSDSYTVSSSTTYASTKALVDGLATKANDANVVHLAGTETITGTKTFSASPLFELGVRYKTATLGYQSINAYDAGWAFGTGSTTNQLNFNGTTGYSYTFPNANGTLALTSNLSAYQPLLTNPITGTGTTNYLPKFTGASALGNSIIYDNGTSLGIGGTSPLQTLDVFGVSRISSSAPTQEFYSTGNGDVWGSIKAQTSGTGSGASLVFSTKRDGNTASDKVIITQDGKVGIGATSPDNGLLTILKATSRATEASYGLAIQSNASNVYTELLLGADDSVDCGVIQTAAKNTSFTTKKLALQPQGGNVLIGTTTDNGVDKLQVNGSGYFSGNLGIGASSSNEKLKVEDNSFNSTLRLNQTASTFNSTLLYGTVAATSGTFDFIGMYNNGVAKFNVSNNGSVTASSFKIPSGLSTQYLMADGSVTTATSTSTYKVYTALLTQSGTSAPTAVVLENTLGGTVVWTRSSTGIYLATLGSAFTTNKTFITMNTGHAINGFEGASWVDNSNIQVVTYLNGPSYSDGRLSINGASIEIRVYK